MFMKALDEMRAAGATIVEDQELLPDAFLTLTDAIHTDPFRREGVDTFLRDFGPSQYHSTAEYERAVGSPLPGFLSGGRRPIPAPRMVENDPDVENILWEPQRKARGAYEAALERFHLDGLVYPSAQMPPNDETIPGQRSSGPHSNTGWVNTIGVPAVVVPGGFYVNGLPFGLELSARPWRDGDLLAWAYGYEQATHHRKQAVLIIAR
jgi:Asp-tRNA(Asn)/Glu-tRNA(Gln) amidotransferase A subunit family amidase